MGTFTVLTIVDDDTAAQMVAAALELLMPTAEIRAVEQADVGRLPEAAALIVTSTGHARLARASNFVGGIVVMAARPSDDEAAALRALGAHVVAADAPIALLAEALAHAIPSAPDGRPHMAQDALYRARRLLAAGEIALTLQHEFNNPLAALMAEVQMLQMDAPNADVLACAGRMVELVRRLTELSRSLDVVKERKPAASRPA